MQLSARLFRYNLRAILPINHTAYFCRHLYMRLKKTFLLATSISLLGGCAGSEEALQSSGYRTARAQSSLEVPPDLVNTSSANLQRASDEGTYSQNKVLPPMGDIEMRSSGDKRWLEIPESADSVWDKTLDFANKSGVPVLIENKRDGILETDWIGDTSSESGTKQMIRASLGNIVGRPPVNDKYTIWLERINEQRTALHVTHSQLNQFIIEPVGDQKETIKTGWAETAGDGFKAVKLLREMAAFFGGAVIETDNSSRVVMVETTPVHIVLNEKSDAAWDIVRTAITTSPYTPLDDVPEKNLIKVKEPKKKGFWSGITPAKKFGVVITPTADQRKTNIYVTNTKGKEIERGDSLPVLYAIAGELRRGDPQAEDKQ